MLLLTSANNYTSTVLFCGGSDMPVDYYKNDWPFSDGTYPASANCQHLIPEPPDGSSPAYEQDDDMLERHMMG